MIDTTKINKDVAIVIPALNEQNTIGNLIKKSKKFAEVIVIDDNSTDNTVREARKNGARVFSNKTNLGYSRTIKNGIIKARELGFKIIVSIDADGEHSPDFINIFINQSKKVPIVFGVRTKKQRIAEIIFCKYFQTIYGVRDIMCGMRAINFDILGNIKIEKKNDDLGISFLISLLKKNVSYVEVKISGKERSGSPRFGSGLTANLNILLILFKFFLKKL